MGVFNALYNAVSGMQAQSYSLQNISGNIANSQTTAFKRLDTSFSDLIQDDQPSHQQSGSVLATSRSSNDIQGGIQNAGTGTFMAVNGQGYFIVEKPENFVDNQPVFNGVNFYTRRGDYQLDKNGFLVNGAGYYLMGIPVNATTGNPVGSVPQILQFSNGLLPANATTQINYEANLPSWPQIAGADKTIPGTELLNPASFLSNPLAVPAQPAKLMGVGATLLPDAKATGTGALGYPGGLLLATPLESGVGNLALAIGDQVTVTTASGVNNYTVGAGDTIATLIGALSGGAAAVTVSLTGGGELQFQSNNFLDTVTLTDNGAGAVLGGLGGAGFGAAAFNPTNLVTQGAVLNGQTLDLTVDSNPLQQIVFGTGGGQIATMAGLTAQLQLLAGVNPVGTGVNPANGNMTIIANNTIDTLTLGGSFDPTQFGITTAIAYPWNQTVIGADESTFLAQSLAGGSITAYDGTGSPVDMTFRWSKIDSTTMGGTDKWNLFYQVNSNAAGATAAWINVGTNFTFDAAGQLNPPIGSLTLNNVTVNGQSLGNVQLVFGPGGLTQFANSSGTVQITMLQQDGSPAGTLGSISVDSQGRVVGAYSNGKTVPMAQVTLANFNGQNYLKHMDGGAFSETADSGPPLLNASGKVVGSALESSNVDIADEFSKLIITQQAYSANTRIITTTNTMVQDLLNVIR